MQYTSRNPETGDLGLYEDGWNLIGFVDEVNEKWWRNRDRSSKLFAYYLTLCERGIPPTKAAKEAHENFETFEKLFGPIN